LEASVVATIAKRRGKWRVQIRRNGHALSKTFIRKMDAEDWAREAELPVDRQLNPAIVRLSRKNTFGSLVDLHIDDLHTVGNPLRRSKDHTLRALRKRLGLTPLTHLTRDKLIQYGRERSLEGAGPATLAVDISFIGTILKHAAAVHGVAVDVEAVNAARLGLRRLGLVGQPDERDRRPTEEELERLFGHFDRTERPAFPMTRLVQFAIATGMRQDEIFRVTWDTLDARTRTIMAPDRKDPRKKAGNDQRVPLLSATGYDAYQLLLDQRDLRLNGPRCFPYNGRSVGSSFRRACKDLKIIDLRFHDLRHEATSRLFEAGLTIEQVPLVTGHSDQLTVSATGRRRAFFTCGRLARPPL
jgi:integrase